MIEEVARKIDEYGFNRVIVDPVMIAKGGASLLHDESVATLKELLIPRSYAITPNVPEAETLTGMTIRSLDDRKSGGAARKDGSAVCDYQRRAPARGSSHY